MNSTIKQNLRNILPYNSADIDAMMGKWAEKKFENTGINKFDEEFMIQKEYEVYLRQYNEMAVQTAICNLCYTRRHQLEYDVDTLTFKSDKAGVIPSGMKITRAISRGLLDADFMESNRSLRDDEVRLKLFKDRIINEMSMQIQTAKSKGKLYISANPMDFATLSESNAGWRSCQALDGGFASATMSYMMDSRTLVAGFSGSKKAEISLTNDKTTEWYSKRWRALVYLGENSFAIGRNYPYVSDTLSEEISKMVIKTFYPNRVVVNSGTRPYAEAMGPVYIDSFHSYTSFEARECDDAVEEIQVGADIKCVECGDHYGKEESDVDCTPFTCWSCCGNYSYCEHCDDRVHEDDTRWVSGHDICVCESCFDQDFAYCECCSDAYNVNDMTRDSHGDLYCDHCAGEKLTHCDGDCSEILPNKEVTVTDGGSFCDSCYDDYLHSLEEDSDNDDASPIKVGENYLLRSVDGDDRNTLNGFIKGQRVEVLEVKLGRAKIITVNYVRNPVIGYTAIANLR